MSTPLGSSSIVVVVVVVEIVVVVEVVVEVVVCSGFRLGFVGLMKSSFCSYHT